MNVLKNFFWNAGYQVFAIIIPLVTVPYVNRVLGPVGIGINAYTNSIVQYFVIFAGLGISVYGNREVAYNRDSPEKMSKIFWELVVLRLGTVAIAFIGYIFVIINSDKYALYYLAQAGYLIGVAFDISWFFQGIEDFKITVLRNSMVKVAALVLIFLFVRDDADILIYICILSGSQLVGFMTLWPYIRHKIRLVSFNMLRIKKHLMPAIQFLIPQVATQTYLQFNKTMLGMIVGVTASGFFDNSDKIVRMALALVTATGTVLLPHAAHSFSKGDMNSVRKSLEVSMHCILVLSIPLTFGIMSVAGPFTVIFFGHRFTEVAPLMTVESIIIVLIGIGNAVGIQYLLPTNQMRIYTRSILFGSLANIALNIPLILMLGAMGATISTVIAEGFIAAYQLFAVRDQLNIKAMFKETWKYLFAGIFMYFTIKISLRVANHGLASIVISSIIGMASFLIILFCLKPKILLSYIKMIKG